MTSRGHFFSKWANSSGHFLRLNSCGHLVTFRGHFGVNYSGHFLMVITNSANPVDQGVRGKAPARLSEHC